MSIGNGAPAWPSVIVSNGRISRSEHTDGRPTWRWCAVGPDITPARLARPPVPLHAGPAARRRARATSTAVAVIPLPQEIALDGAPPAASGHLPTLLQVGA